MENKLIFKINPNFYNDIFDFIENRKLKYYLSLYNKKLQKKFNLTLIDFQKEYINHCCYSIKNVFDFDSFNNAIRDNGTIKINVKDEDIKSIYENNIYERMVVDFSHFHRIQKEITEKFDEITSKIIYNFDVEYKKKINFKLLDHLPIDFNKIRAFNINAKKKKVNLFWKDLEIFFSQSKIFETLIKLQLQYVMIENWDIINSMKNLKILLLDKVKMNMEKKILLSLEGLEELKLNECVLKIDSKVFLSLNQLIIFGGFIETSILKLPNIETLFLKNNTIDIDYYSCLKLNKISVDNINIFKLNSQLNNGLFFQYFLNIEIPIDFLVKIFPNLRTVKREQKIIKKTKIDENERKNYILGFYKKTSKEPIQLIYNSESQNSDLEKSIEIYINENKINFCYEHELYERGENLCRFIFDKELNDISYMFYNCSNLIYIFFSLPYKITNIKHLFDSCTSLETLNFIYLNTENIIDMSYTFNYCSSLTSLNLSNFKTGNVIDMSYMFYYCSSLTSLNLSNFNTEKVNNMSYMFSYCTSLTSLNLSNFNTEKVINMSNMFYYCTSLKNIDLSNFNTEKVINMSYMFSYCTSLISLNLSNFNTEKVNNMSNMFSYCKSLLILNLSNSNITDANITKLFFGCDSLISLKLLSCKTQDEYIKKNLELNDKCKIKLKNSI